MSEESLPKLTKAPIPVQTHTLKIEERLAKGKALRDVASRKAQKEWKPPANRPDPVELLIESCKGRLEELLPIRYSRMMVSPFNTVFKERRETDNRQQKTAISGGLLFCRTALSRIWRYPEDLLLGK